LGKAATLDVGTLHATTAGADEQRETRLSRIADLPRSVASSIKDFFLNEKPTLYEMPISQWEASLIIFTLTGISAVGCMSTGVLTIGLPRIAGELEIPPGFLLWPSSIYSLVSGCTLLLCGTIADHVGNRIMNIVGTFMLGAFILATGFSQTSYQIILFRAIQGLANSMCLPTVFSIIASTFPNGKRRNVAFASTGLAQPLGWSIGLIVGGVCEDTSMGWRFGFYISAGIAIILGFLALWILPEDSNRPALSVKKLARSVDWIGVLISSASLGGLSYVFA
jgi:MFS family permease